MHAFLSLFSEPSKLPCIQMLGIVRGVVVVSVECGYYEGADIGDGPIFLQLEHSFCFEIKVLLKRAKRMACLRPPRAKRPACCLYPLGCQLALVKV